MYGSEKQVNWAQDIIAKLEETARTMIENGRNAVKAGQMPADMFAKIEGAIDAYLASVKADYTHASDVINDREMLPIRLTKMVKRAID